MFHYTDKSGYNAIGLQPTWSFKASQPPGHHPFGAYFTDLPPETPNLAKRLRIPRTKVEWYFEFVDIGDLKPLSGGRGVYIFYSPHDYRVACARQLNHGET